MSTPVDIGTSIVRSPDTRGGRSRVAGTDVTVRRIVGWCGLGLNAEEIADQPTCDWAGYAVIVHKP